MLDGNTKPTSIHEWLNQDLVGLKSLQILDKLLTMQIKLVFG